MIAMPTPISSPTGASCSDARSIRTPRAATWTPPRSRGARRRRAAPRRPPSRGRPGRSSSGRRRRRAGRPGDTAPPWANGSATSLDAVEALDLVERACDRAPWARVGDWPSSTLKTSVESAPAKPGECARKRSSAFWDSVPGMLKSSAASPPAPAAAPSRTMTSSAPARLRFQCGEGAREAREEQDMGLLRGGRGVGRRQQPTGPVGGGWRPLGSNRAPTSARGTAAGRRRVVVGRVGGHEQPDVAAGRQAAVAQDAAEAPVVPADVPVEAAGADQPVRPRPRRHHVEGDARGLVERVAQLGRPAVADRRGPADLGELGRP